MFRHFFLRKYELIEIATFILKKIRNKEYVGHKHMQISKIIKKSASCFLKFASPVYMYQL